MADWSTLPSDLVHSISLRLPSSIDRIRIRSVCSPWRSAVPPLPSSSSCRYPILPSAGICNTCSGLRLSRRTVYSLQSPFPEDDDASWIIKLERDDSSREMHLIHPLTRSQMLECFPKSFSFMDIRVKELGEEYTLKYIDFRPSGRPRVEDHLIVAAGYLHMEKVAVLNGGKSVEPTWYVPIIPTVLVNGSEGTGGGGTGWSPFVPNYNPRDIIANVRRLLNDEEMVPMHPWYKGFRGAIEKTATNEVGDTYIVTGAIKEVDEKTLTITELPIWVWTQDYEKFLNSVCANDKESTYPFIEGFRNYSFGNKVHFLVYLTAENLNAAKEEGLVKKFKLSSTISTRNMHLFDPNGVIKKYETPEQILEEFFHVRLDFYEKRKKAMLKNLENDLLKCSNTVKYITSVAEGSIKPFNTRVPGAADDMEENGGAGDYDYLLSLPVKKGRELMAEKDKLEQEVEDLRNATIKSLWVKDLDALERELDEMKARKTAKRKAEVLSDDSDYET